jgi:hypothetical protein
MDSIAEGTRNVFILIESIYSMDGDVAPIKEFIAVVDEQWANCGQTSSEDRRATDACPHGHWRG